MSTSRTQKIKEKLSDRHEKKTQRRKKGTNINAVYPDKPQDEDKISN